MKPIDIKRIVVSTGLFDYTVNDYIPMWELKVDEAPFPLRHGVNLYVDNDEKHLIANYMSYDFEAQKMAVEKELFTVPIDFITKETIINCVEQVKAAQYDLYKDEKDYLVKKNLQEIKKDF